MGSGRGSGVSSSGVRSGIVLEVPDGSSVVVPGGPMCWFLYGFEHGFRN